MLPKKFSNIWSQTFSLVAKQVIPASVYIDLESRSRCVWYMSLYSRNRAAWAIIIFGGNPPRWNISRMLFRRKEKYSQQRKPIETSMLLLRIFCSDIFTWKSGRLAWRCLNLNPHLCILLFGRCWHSLGEKATKIFPSLFLASPDAQEVMWVSQSVSQSVSHWVRVSWLDWCDPGEWWYL